MYKFLVGLFVAFMTLFAGCASLSEAHEDAPPTHSAQFGVAAEKMFTLAFTLCHEIYPPQSSRAQCVSKMIVGVDKKFPNAGSDGQQIFTKSLKGAVLSGEIPEGDVLLLTRFWGACFVAENLASCADDFYTAMMGSFDQHTEYRSKQETVVRQETFLGKYVGIGLSLERGNDGKTFVVAEEPFEQAPAYKAGIRLGDEIVAVDGVSGEHFADIQGIANAIRGGVGTEVALMIKRDGRLLSMRVTRGFVSLPSVRSAIIVSDGKMYGLLNIRSFGKGSADRAQEELKFLLGDITKGKIEGIIINLQGNPGGSLEEVVQMLHLFVKQDNYVLYRYGKGTQPYELFVTPKEEMSNKLPILVVVNKHSASASEVFTATMKHYGRATIAGTSGTYGKGLIQSVMPYQDRKRGEDGSSMAITIAEYLIGTQSDWIPVQCLGVTPDIVFQYPSTPLDPAREEPKGECDDARKISSLGPMPGAVAHPPIAVANPALFHSGEKMLKAYIGYVEERIRKNK